MVVAFQNSFSPSDLVALKIGDYPLESWMSFETESGYVSRYRFGVSTPKDCGYHLSYFEECEGQVGEPLVLGKRTSLSVKEINKVLRGGGFIGQV